MEKIINPCKCKVYTRTTGKEVSRDAFVKIEYKDSKLSIHGVVAPLPSGNCLGSCGQCVDEIRRGIPADGWTADMLKTLCDIWDRWHLNDARPYCSHMRELGWVDHLEEKVKIEKWTLTAKACKRKEEAEKRALSCLRKGEPFYPTEDETAYANLKYSIDVYNDEDVSCRYGILYRDSYELKEKDCLGRSNTEYKIRGHISYKDNELGFIGKLCPVCGYEYGTAWKMEEVPEDVIAWLESLPDSKTVPAWI